ncbi:unnamed protein product, partial [Timema podura]|nr:unnamed protein product [Timema podura]
HIKTVCLGFFRYNTALNILENRCKLSNDEEESKQRKLVVKVCVNLAVCYNKIGSSKQACVKCRNALYHDAKNAKALFNFGRALLMLGDYDEAHRRLTAALKLAPNDTSISEELKLLKEKKNKFQVSEKQMMQRMFSSKPAATKSNEKIEEGGRNAQRNFLKKEPKKTSVVGRLGSDDRFSSRGSHYFFVLWQQYKV